nr:PREDICTED: butyrophilin subfamily 3 member A2-like [Latimeria chalumnae]|eukprot:XP_014351213.1 PREDICTED: butyrophilin subfamily 3 member A2-like [Latimeria chalumnae]
MDSFSQIKNHMVVYLLLQTSTIMPEKFSILAPDRPIVAIVGKDAVLPCQLSPKINALNMTIRWLKTKSGNTVHTYRQGSNENNKQDPLYQGRTELFGNELVNGNVSLRLKNIQLLDEGLYMCSVDSNIWYEDAKVSVVVGATGSNPLIYMDGYEGKTIRLGCKSFGWYPKPEVMWTDGNRNNLTSVSEAIEKQEDGLFDVNSQTLVRKESNHKLTCIVHSYSIQKKQDSSLLISG